MTMQETGVIERITTDVEKLLPLGGWVKTLVVGGIVIGVWVTTIQLEAREATSSALKAEKAVDAVELKFEELLKAQAETNQRLARIEGRLEGNR